MMKTRNYYRPSTVSLGKKKRVVRRKSGARFFLKFFLLLFVLAVCVGGGWLVFSKGYALLTDANLSDWRVKKVAVSGLAGPLQEQILALARPYQGQSFRAEQGAALRQLIRQKYPMLKQVQVKRGILSGTLTVSVSRRAPIAKFRLPEGNVKYMDETGVVYTDADFSAMQEILPVELEGAVPEKLSTEFVELVQSALKLRNELNFAFLHLNQTDNTVKMYMPDNSAIDFGPAVQLKNKAARAAQILTLAREKYAAPFVLDFRFFENGKVFLTQKAP